VQQVHADPQIVSYAVRLAAATRVHPAVRYGASPRGSVALVRAARALAGTESMGFTTPDHLKFVAGPVLAHRLVLTPEAELNGVTQAQVVAEVLAATPAPGLAGPVR
jgi:MoxR-like ATPase